MVKNVTTDPTMFHFRHYTDSYYNMLDDFSSALLHSVMSSSKSSAITLGGWGGANRHLDLFGCLLQYQIWEIMEDRGEKSSTYSDPLSSESILRLPLYSRGLTSESEPLWEYEVSPSITHCFFVAFYLNYSHIFKCLVSKDGLKIVFQKTLMNRLSLWFQKPKSQIFPSWC